MVRELTPSGNQSSCSKFIEEFVNITGLIPAFGPEYKIALEKLVAYLATQSLLPLKERRRQFIAHVNWKFRLNAHGLSRFFAEAAKIGITFHYHQKCQIQRAFDLCDYGLFRAVLNKRGISRGRLEHLLGLFNPIHQKSTIEHLSLECRKPSKLRKEKGDRNIEKEIIEAQFSAFMWVSVPERDMHRFFDPMFSEKNYKQSFWEQLCARSPHLFLRDNALHVVRINQEVIEKLTSVNAIRHALCALLQSLYNAINNYGFLAIVIEPILFGSRSIQWEIAADMMLFAEKHRELPLDKAYFQWERIRSETIEYIKNVDVNKAKFNLVNEGFTYRDCFVLADSNDQVGKLLLIFQKNERDDTLIPCPTCWSMDVQGNSYSSLGVRSWECNNLLCPDRSKYNRGKRYSFRGLIMQQAIFDCRNEIPIESIRRWMRDVAYNVSQSEIMDMLVRHYSINGDTVHVHNWSTFNAATLGRKIKHHDLQLKSKHILFWNGPFFKRFMAKSPKDSAEIINLGDDNFQVLVGDSARVLRSLPAATFDGAVTSPPYFNAREYAQWPNMYCYLHDMFEITQEVFRTLKPGAIYLYNVFDYFDNERTVVFSAMGQRRMLLSAYTVYIFRRAGFELIGNIVWDKGDIEGKRGFNAGNFSPYYQSPFNCWEHIFIFRKPFSSGNKRSKTHLMFSGSYSRTLRLKPVIKMVRGKNTHGHSAPFPDAIPELLISRLPKGSIVLDPFAGSLTTGRVAERFGVRSICIEKSEEYCKLGLRMLKTEREAIKKEHSQLSLF
jgi:DNA modification methylase